MMRISWETTTLGTLHKIVPDDEVMEFLECLSLLGFTAEVTQE